MKYLIIFLFSILYDSAFEKDSVVTYCPHMFMQQDTIIDPSATKETRVSQDTSRSFAVRPKLSSVVDTLIGERYVSTLSVEERLKKCVEERQRDSENALKAEVAMQKAQAAKKEVEDAKIALEKQNQEAKEQNQALVSQIEVIVAEKKAVEDANKQMKANLDSILQRYSNYDILQEHYSGMIGTYKGEPIIHFKGKLFQLKEILFRMEYKISETQDVQFQKSAELETNFKRLATMLAKNKGSFMLKAVVRGNINATNVDLVGNEIMNTLELQGLLKQSVDEIRNPRLFRNTYLELDDGSSNTYYIEFSIIRKKQN